MDGAAEGDVVMEVISGLMFTGTCHFCEHKRIVVFILKKVKSCTSFCTRKLSVSIDKNSYKLYTQAKQVIYEILCHPFHGPICLFVRSSNVLCLDNARPSHTWYRYKFPADGLHDHSSVRVDHCGDSRVPEVFRSI